MSELGKLFNLGAHFGFNRSRLHPTAKPFVFGYKNRHAIIDLEQTSAQMEKAKDFVKKLVVQNGTVLLVGSKNEARAAIAEAAERINMPYVSLRWVGGTLTNFKNIRGRINRLQEIEEADKSGELTKYTKKERLLIAKERANLNRLFGSLVNLEKSPQALIVVDSKEEEIAVTEAVKLKIPVISLSGSDCDLSAVNYPIVANDSSRDTIKWFLGELVAAFLTSRAEGGKVSGDGEGEVVK